MALSNAGCLVTDSPAFQPPEAIQPLLANLDPATSRILEISRKPGTDPASNIYADGITLYGDVLSEDRQEKLYGAVFLDFPLSTRFPAVCSLDLGTGTLAKARRLICPLVIKSSVMPGCHSISVLLSHKPTIFGGRVDGDLGLTTWWAQIGMSPPDYAPCVPDPVPGDAGADVRTEGGNP